MNDLDLGGLAALYISCVTKVLEGIKWLRIGMTTTPNLNHGKVIGNARSACGLFGKTLVDIDTVVNLSSSMLLQALGRTLATKLET